MHARNKPITYTYETIITMCLYTILVTSIIAGQNTIRIFNHTITTGMLIFPLTYILIAMSTELSGIKKTRLIIFTAGACNIFMGAMIIIFTKLPVTGSFVGNAELYQQFSYRLSYFLFASTFAFVISENANAWILTRLKILIGGERLFLRAFLATTSAIAIDTWILFPVSIFYVKSERIDHAIVETFIIMLIKIVYDILLLPLFWIIIALIKKEDVNSLPSFAKPFTSTAYLNKTRDENAEADQ